MIDGFTGENQNGVGYMNRIVPESTTSRNEGQLHRKLTLEGPWFVPVLTLGVVVAAYGLLIPWLGFYWDDYECLEPLRIVTTEGFSEILNELRYAMSFDRPDGAYTRLLGTILCGDSPLAWHIFALVGRWFTVVAFWIMMRAIWPSRHRENAVAALLFAVYPGFRLQGLAAVMGSFMPSLTAVLLSCALPVFALRNRKYYWYFTSAAVFFTVLSQCDYFVGFQLVRYVLIGVVLYQTAWSGKSFWRKSWQWILHCMPYAVVAGAFLVWRLFLIDSIRSPGGVLRLLEFAPLWWIRTTGALALHSLGVTTLGAWGQVVRDGLFEYSFGGFISYVLLVVSSGTILYVVLSRHTLARETQDHSSDARWGIGATILGFTALVLAILPFLVIGKKIWLGMPTEFYLTRLTIAAMAGVSIMMTAVLFSLFQSRTKLAIVTSLLLALAIGFQFRSAEVFKDNWQKQKKVFWQIYWRMPSLSSRSLMVYDAARIPERSRTMWPARPHEFLEFMNFHLFPTSYPDHQFTVGTIPVRSMPFNVNGKSGMYVEITSRGLTYADTVQSFLLVDISPYGFVRFIGKDSDLPLNSPLYPYLPHADLSRIRLDGPILTIRPSALMFGDEPAHDWTYYFQKADLNRQLGDWERVAALGDSMMSSGSIPRDPAVRLLFAEGYVRQGHFDKARNILAELTKVDTSSAFAFYQFPKAYPVVALERFLHRLETEIPRDSMNECFYTDIHEALDTARNHLTIQSTHKMGWQRRLVPARWFRQRSDHRGPN
jgi:hypothetical protein